MDKIFLNIGCGNCKLNGFINIDLEPTADMQLDVRNGLPFDDDSVNAIYSEHFIEHLTQSEAVAFLRKCRRILKYEGVLRISTPDLSNSVQRYLNNDWRKKTNLDSYGFGWLNTPCEYLNTAMREWGHKWLYDETELVRLLKYAGFYQFKRCESGISKSLPLFNNLESRSGDFLIIEAQKRKIKKKPDNPLVSIFIPAYNYRYFSNALESSLNQSYDNVEIIIGDDSHCEKIKDIVEILKKTYPAKKIHYFRQGAPGQGERKNFITCLSKSKGELIKPLYDDDLLEPRCVERMVEYINKHPSVTLVTSYRQLIDSEGRKLPDTNATKRIVQKDALINGSTIVRAIVINRINFIGEPSTVMFRKEDLIDEYPDILSFAGRKPIMNGDVTTWMKLLSRGDCIYITESLSSFRRHKEQAQQQPGIREKGLLAWEHALFDAKRMGFLSPSVPQLSGQPLSEKSLGAKKIFSASIVIPVFNQIEYTKQCLETLYKNTPAKNDFEVIVVDNASTDSTPEFLEEALKRYHSLRVLTNSENLGFSRSCNQGARAAEGKYILFLNNDTKVQSGWIEPLLYVLNNDPTVAAVGSKMLFPDNTIQHAGVVVLDDKKLPDPLVARHIYYGQKYDFPKANQPCTYQVLTAACLLVRKYAFEEVGGFDEEYWNGYEDVDLCFKLQKRGWLLTYQPKSIVTHYESQSGPERFRATQHNIERLHQKWLGKIVPDLVVEANGSVQETNAGRIRPYILPKQLYRQPDVSIKDGDPLTSIIILTHNQIKYTKKCIESIFKFTNSPFELIVVDNGSSDSTVMYLEKIVQSYENEASGSRQNTNAAMQRGKKKVKKIKLINKACKRMKVIRNDKNLGFAAGNNQGMASVNGDYVLLMNNDVVVTPAWLDRMISCAELSPKIGIVGPMSNYVSGPQLVKKVSYDTTSLARLNKFTKGFAEKNTAQAKLIWRVVGFCMLIKRAVIDKIGGMDDRYGLGNFEDDDFSLRAGLAGFESRIAEDCFVHHFGSRTFIGAKINYGESLHEKWEIFKKKWGMPQDLPYGSSYDFSQIAKRGFIKEKHYFPLTEKDFSAIAEKNASFDLLETREEIDSKVKPKPIDKDITASIIIPVQKGQEQLEKCAESIQKHTPESYELIFAKNGSKSSTMKWLVQYVKENPRYQLINCGKDANIAKCYNEGIKASSSEYIVFLHSDVVVTKGWLTGLLECVKNAPDASIVGPMMNNTSGIQKVLAADKITLNHLDDFAKSFKESNRYRRIHSRNLSELCLLFRQDLVEKIGFFDESLGRSNFETDDFCLKAALEGHRNLIAGDVFVYSCRNGDLIRNKKAFLEKWNGIDAQNRLGKNLLTLNAIENANELYQKGQIVDAVKMLVKGIGRDPGEKRLYYTLAEMLINNKQFKDAFDILNEIPLDDQDVMKLTLIGYCMEGMERYDEAEEYADRALYLNPASALALNLKGILAFGKGDKATAEDFFKRAIDSDPGYGEPYTNLGTLKWDQEAEEALNLYEKGFILSPTIMDTVTIYHSAVTNLGKFERAEPIFRDASVLHPNNRRLKFLIIDILVQQGKHDLAMEEIEGAMIAFGIDDGILSAALQVRETLGSKEFEKASKKKITISLCMIVKNEEQHLAKCLRSVKPVVDEMIVVDTGSTDRTKDIAKAFGAKVFGFEWTNDFSEARNYSILKASGAWIFVLDADEVISSIDYDSLRKIVKKPRTRSSAYYFVSRNYTALTNTVGWVSNDSRYTGEQAGTGWYPSKKVRLFPSDSRIRFENAVHELVEPSLKKSGIKLKECSIPVHHYGKLSTNKVVSKGQEYYLLGKTKLEGKTDDVQSLTELAIQALELGKYEEALELWQRVLEIKPDNTKALLNIGGIYLELGRYKDALRASRKAMALGSHLKEVVLNYSSSELFIGDIEKSVSSLENLVRNEPEYPPAIGMLSTAYFILGEKEKGLKYIDKIKIMGFNPSDYLYKRAKQFISAGKTDYAILLLEIATECNNANRDVISLLSECYRTYGTVVGNVAIQSKNLESISSPEIRQ